jgi:hypothetical protein
MNLPKSIRTTHGDIRSVEEALRFVQRRLPAELQIQPRWTFARDLLVRAQATEKRRDLNCAYRQVQQALQNDLLLKEARP